MESISCENSDPQAAAPASPTFKRKQKLNKNALPSPKSNYQYYQQFCNVFTLNSQLIQQVFFP